MKKKGILLAVVVMLGAAGFVQAEEQAKKGELHGAIDVTYLSQYIWRGFEVFGKHGAIQPSINLDLFGTGFGISTVAHVPMGSGYVDGQRWDYSLYYHNMLFEGEAYQTDYTLSYVYYNYPRLSSHTRCSWDLQEINAMLSWPKIIPGGVVPSYVLVRLWPSNSGSDVSQAAGWAHIFMLDYGWVIKDLTPEIPEQVLNLHAEIVYNDGADPRPFGTGVDHDLSNAVLGISTNFDLGHNLTFTPGLYCQKTLDKSVCEHDSLFWVSLGIKYSF